MKILGKQIVVCMVLFSQAFCGQALAKENEKGLCYRNVVDTENSNFEEGIWKYRFISSAGEELILEEGRSHTFFVVDGEILFEDLLIENGKAYIAVDRIGNILDISKREEEKVIVLESVPERVTIDKKSLLLRNDHGKIIEKAISDAGEIYVPLRRVSEEFHAAVTYDKNGIMPLYNPFINIDTRKEKISKDQALQKAKKMLQEGYCLYESKEDIDYFDKAEIQNAIDHMECVHETASFWIIKGPRLLIADKATGTIYYKLGDGKAGHGSYIEVVAELDGNVDDIFENIKLRGFPNN